eukprot:g3696.t1
MYRPDPRTGMYAPQKAQMAPANAQKPTLSNCNPNGISGALRYIMAQGLFKQTCPCCGKTFEAKSKEELQKLMSHCPCQQRKLQQQQQQQQQLSQARLQRGRH